MHLRIGIWSQCLEVAKPLCAFVSGSCPGLCSLRVRFLFGFVFGLVFTFGSRTGPGSCSRPGSCPFRVWLVSGCVSGSCLVRVRFVSGLRPLRLGSRLGSCRVWDRVGVRGYF